MGTIALLGYFFISVSATLTNGRPFSIATNGEPIQFRVYIMEFQDGEPVKPTAGPITLAIGAETFDITGSAPTGYVYASQALLYQTRSSNILATATHRSTTGSAYIRVYPHGRLRLEKGTLSFYGKPGSTYEIQASSNLTQWTPLTPVAASGEKESIPAQAGQFYRYRVQ